MAVPPLVVKVMLVRGPTATEIRRLPPAPGGAAPSFVALRAALEGLWGPTPHDPLVVEYTDDEDDTVRVGNEAEWAEAVRIHRLMAIADGRKAATFKLLVRPVPGAPPFDPVAEAAAPPPPSFAAIVAAAAALSSPKPFVSAGAAAVAPPPPPPAVVALPIVAEVADVEAVPSPSAALADELELSTTADDAAAAPPPVAVPAAPSLPVRLEMCGVAAPTLPLLSHVFGVDAESVLTDVNSDVRAVFDGHVYRTQCFVGGVCTVQFTLGQNLRRRVISQCNDWLHEGDEALALGVRGYELATQLWPRDGELHYNLACGYTLQRRLWLAEASLRAALRNGFIDVPQILTDPDLAILRRDAAFGKVLPKLPLKPQPPLTMSEVPELEKILTVLPTLAIGTAREVLKTHKTAQKTLEVLLGM